VAEESIRFETTVGGERESIAESNIAEQLTLMARKASDVYKELALMLKDLDDMNKVGVEKRYGRVKLLKDGVEESGINLTEYIIRVSPALTFKDVYVEIVQDLIRFAEHAEASANRSLLLVTKGFEKLPDNIYAYLDAVVRKILEMLDVISQMISKLRNGKQARELYQKIISLENSVDDLHREIGLETIKHYSNDVGALILVKELADKLEDAADILKRVGTNLRYIALHR